jgi:hypothetical protein
MPLVFPVSVYADYTARVCVVELLRMQMQVRPVAGWVPTHVQTLRCFGRARNCCIA